MKKIYILAAATLALVACDKTEDNPAPSSVEARIFATIGESTISRASDNKWSEGDRIGITVTVGDNFQPHVNMLYTTDNGDGAFTGNPIYFYKPMVLTAYYPFTGVEKSAPDIIEAITDAGSQTGEKQPEIDFLWARETEYHVVDNKPEVHFQFAHKMSKVTLIFENANEVDGFDVGDIVSYQIEGLVLDGSFDPATGDCSAKSDADAKTLEIDVEGVRNGKPLPSLIIFPQNPGKDKVKLHIYSDEINDSGLLQHYSCLLNFKGDETEGVIEPGKNYLYTVSIGKAGMTVNKASITNWTDEDCTDEAVSED